MYEPKTKETDADVIEYLNNVENKTRRADGFALLEMMRDATGLEPKMWGPTIVGFGQYHYKYDSGHEGDAAQMGFAPRKQSLTLYLDRYAGYDEALEKLGKHKTSVACLYINKLADVDLEVLRQMIDDAWAHARATTA